MSASGRTPRDERRRRLGQNFLRPQAAERFVAEADVVPGELVVDVGAGAGALAQALARRGAQVVAVEIDPIWAEHLRLLARRQEAGRIQVVRADVVSWRPPAQQFRVMGCIPFGSTTTILRMLLDRPYVPLARADLILQWEVARKRATTPPTTLLSTAWAPWWEFRLGRRISAEQFRPRPRVDGGVLVVTRRAPPLLPVLMAPAFATFVRAHWPFDESDGVDRALQRFT